MVDIINVLTWVSEMGTVFLNTIHSTFSVQGGVVSEPLYTKYFFVDCGSRASGEKGSRGLLLPSHQTQASSVVIDIVTERNVKY